jgi:hypothetical protein
MQFDNTNVAVSLALVYKGLENLRIIDIPYSVRLVDSTTGAVATRCDFRHRIPVLISIAVNTMCTRERRVSRNQGGSTSTTLEIVVDMCNGSKRKGRSVGYLRTGVDSNHTNNERAVSQTLLVSSRVRLGIFITWKVLDFEFSNVFVTVWRHAAGTNIRLFRSFVFVLRNVVIRKHIVVVLGETELAGITFDHKLEVIVRKALHVFQCDDGCRIDVVLTGNSRGLARAWAHVRDRDVLEKPKEGEMLFDFIRYNPTLSSPASTDSPDSRQHTHSRR